MPAWWLPGGHAQTILPALAGRRASLSYARERWASANAAGQPDGGERPRFFRLLGRLEVPHHLALRIVFAHHLVEQLRHEIIPVGQLARHPAFQVVIRGLAGDRHGPQRHLDLRGQGDRSGAGHDQGGIEGERACATGGPGDEVGEDGSAGGGGEGQEVSFGRRSGVATHPMAEPSGDRV